MKKMSESLPITTPPRRRTDLLAHVQHAFSQVVPSPSSSAASPSSVSVHEAAINRNALRKLEPYHHALLESGSQSAKSSPLPHRRLDKLEGVIREKPASPASLAINRHAFDVTGDIHSTDASPAVLRKYASNGGQSTALMERRFVSNHQESPMPYRKSLPQQKHLMFNDSEVPAVPPHHQPMQYYGGRRSTAANLCGCDAASATNTAYPTENGSMTPMMRRRVESDCSCSRKPILHPRAAEVGGHSLNGMNSDFACSPTLARKYASPARSVLGEPGCFSSPIHQRIDKNQLNAFGSPAKSQVHDSVLFPAKDEFTTDVTDTPLQPDQNIVSGWLKFRDNKRVSSPQLLYLYEYLSNAGIAFRWISFTGDPVPAYRFHETPQFDSCRLNEWIYIYPYRLHWCRCSRLLAWLSDRVLWLTTNSMRSTMGCRSDCGRPAVSDAPIRCRRCQKWMKSTISIWIKSISLPLKEADPFCCAATRTAPFSMANNWILESIDCCNVRSIVTAAIEFG